MDRDTKNLSCTYSSKEIHSCDLGVISKDSICYLLCMLDSQIVSQIIKDDRVSGLIMIVNNMLLGFSRNRLVSRAIIHEVHASFTIIYSSFL